MSRTRTCDCVLRNSLDVQLMYCFFYVFQIFWWWCYASKSVINFKRINWCPPNNLIYKWFVKEGLHTLTDVKIFPPQFILKINFTITKYLSFLFVHNVFTNFREGPAKKTDVLKLDMSGRFAINIVDNLVMVHHQASKVSRMLKIRQVKTWFFVRLLVYLHSFLLLYRSNNNNFPSI